MSPSNEQEKLAEFYRIIDAMAVFTEPALCSIIGTPDTEFGELVGTGTFVRFGDRVYILTARHVAEQAAKEYAGCAHSVGPANRPVPILRPFVLAADRKLDIAVLPVPAEDIAATPVRPFGSAVLAASSADLNDYLFVLGYTGEKSRFSAISQGIVSTVHPYGTVLGTSTLPEYDPAIHFAIEYPGHGQQDSTGREVALPDPHGMSGTAVWRVGRARGGPDWSPQRAEIVGVVHRWDPDCSSLVATRIEPVRSFLERVEADNA